MDSRTNIGYTVQAGASDEDEPEVYEDYVSSYHVGRFAESARFVRHCPGHNPILRDLLKAPTQIVAGDHDDLVPWSNAEYLNERLPYSEIHPLDAGHFAWEEGGRVRRPHRRLGQRRVQACRGERAGELPFDRQGCERE